MDESDPAFHTICDGCGQPRRFDDERSVLIPLKQCSRCLQCWYHDANCQKLHYKVHKKTCRSSPKSITSIPFAETKDAKLQATAPPTTNVIVNRHGEEMFTIQKRTDGEQGVFALQDVQPIDSNSISCRPFVPPILFKTHRTSNCALCFRSLRRVKKPIALSSNPRYPVLLCSEECKIKCESWLPQETQILNGMLAMDYNMLVLSVAVLVYRLLKVVPPDVYMPMQTHPKMMNHSTDHDYEENIHKELVTYTVISMIKQTPFDSSNLYNVMRQDGGWPRITKAVHELLHRNKFNGFTVADHTSKEPEGLGIGLFIGPSYRINHSCNPNAVQTFVLEKGQPPRLDIEMDRLVPINEEIFITYNSELKHMSVKDRRRELLKTYNFHCRCTQCLAEE